MAFYAFWRPPSNDRVDRIKIHRRSSGVQTWTVVALVCARDQYDNWISGWADPDGTAGDSYKVEYLIGNESLGESPIEAAKPVLQVPVEDVWGLTQGLPSNQVSYYEIYKWIVRGAAVVEREIRMSLSERTATKEVYDGTIYNKILGAAKSHKFQLRHRPVIGVDALHYRIRGVGGTQDIEWENLDVQVEHGNDIDGYNPGVISAMPRSLRHPAYGIRFYPQRQRRAVSVLITYRHGFQVWPEPIREAVTKYAAAQIMEVYGQADAPGVSSVSIGGFSQSLSASATTTVYSAMRIEYNKQIEAIKKHYRKALWG